MADIRLQSKSTVDENTILDTDLFMIDSASGGSVRVIPLSALIKAIRGGNVTPGIALSNAAIVLDADKKIEEVGGIEMASNYDPTEDRDVITKEYLDDTRLNEDSPVLLHKSSFAHSDFISGTPVTVKAFAANVVILAIYARVKVGFTDTGSDLLKIGKTGTENYFEADFDVSATGMTIADDATLPYVLTAGESITVTYTGANTDADAGSVEIYVKYARF